MRKDSRDEWKTWNMETPLKAREQERTEILSEAAGELCRLLEENLVDSFALTRLGLNKAQALKTSEILLQKNKALNTTT